MKLSFLTFALFFIPSFVFATDLSGEWSVVGKDNADTKWVGTLVLNPNKEKPRDDDGGEDEVYVSVTNYEGYFDWFGDNGTQGREYVRAKFYPSKNELKLGGTNLENADPNIIQALYKVKVVNDRLEEGTWEGISVVPGKWRGKRKN